MDYEQKEFEHLNNTLVLIASENYPSQDVLNASGSIFQLPYCEGFPGKRYYQGTEIVDKMEQECIDTCLQLFNAKEEYYANVQPNSGASANMIVYNAILQPGDTILAPDVKSLGHISHSHPKSFLAKYHNVVTYGVNENGLLDYENIKELAIRHKPSLIICGASNYSRHIDFKLFREIADEVNAKLMADIAHISLLVAKNQHPTPVGYADFITSTTHKCLKGPRSAFILYKKEFEKQIRLSTIPGLFGGPLEHQIYAKLICFKEALSSEANKYAEQIIKNAKVMAETFNKNNIPIVSGDTENHLMTIDLTEFNVSGKELAIKLEKCGLITNCNAIPNDKRSFLETSGIRIGTPAITARGFNEIDSRYLAEHMGRLINCYRKDKEFDKLEEKHCMNSLEITVYRLTQSYPLKSIYNKIDIEKENEKLKLRIKSLEEELNKYTYHFRKELV